MSSASTAINCPQSTAGDHNSTSGEVLRNDLLTLCKASADQLRLDILRVLSRNSFGVMELSRIFGYKQSGMSHHLKILATAGLLTTRREGNSIFYRRNNQADNPALAALQQTLLSSADLLPLGDEQRQQIEAIQQERAQSCQAFFDTHANQFQCQQEQIAAYELYGVNSAELIDSSFGENKPHRVLEVGPGEGAFLNELSRRFQQVVALDSSAEMLSKARTLAEQQQLDNVAFICGDTTAAELQGQSFDAAVLNMVLHHVPSPAAMLSDLRNLLVDGGHLFITDLCSHDQNWVQDACGDLWQGFDPKELSDWATSVGFSEGQSVYLTQLNGFRVQLRQFVKV